MESFTELQKPNVEVEVYFFKNSTGKLDIMVPTQSTTTMAAGVGGRRGGKEKKMKNPKHSTEEVKI